MERLILIAVGPDHVGLVEKISQFVSDRRCNIEDSKMAVFVGEFALILLIAGTRENLSEISRSVELLSEQTGLKISVKQPSARKPSSPSLPYKLSASCMDHPGVVYKLSTILSQYGVNIESMETETYAAPVSGTPIFRMIAEISVPASLNINALRDRFAEMETEESIDLDLELMK